MAGETINTANLDTEIAGTLTPAGLAGGNVKMAMDTDALAATELEAADVILLRIKVPSNAYFKDIAVYNDDLDANGTPTLAVDIGLYAAEDFTSITSSVATKHSAGDVLDADLIVDGSTALQAATTSWTSLAPDAATLGPEDALKPFWSLLGYDSDPGTVFRLGVVAATAAATGAAGDLSVRLEYIV